MMRALTLIAGFLTILISIAAQLSAIIDDSYTVGNIWFLGVTSGILTIIGAFKINNNKRTSLILLIISFILGVVSILYLFIVPAILLLITITYLSWPNRP
ncbi:hypothetical protein [Gracilibacillus salinarum]|uniref:DUF4064 domain-containing protein n=1 Tax=Gracilibacillus salinarum TaxID=2932255 RepID=A0ABY4GN11_9BACI|nr:hypothetical protein [Gracilibacillus salinarum]UOQ84742.1 hypothetical protein MUN87_19125 [Gracilibacillus salinarum]